MSTLERDLQAWPCCPSATAAPGVVELGRVDRRRGDLHERGLRRQDQGVCQPQLNKGALGGALVCICIYIYMYVDIYTYTYKCVWLWPKEEAEVERWTPTSPGINSSICTVDDRNHA